MHMADALVSPAVAGAMYAASTAAAAYSVKRVKHEDDIKKIPLMGVMGAFVFTAQMINFTIPGTGSSGHLCGGVMATALLGPYAGFLTMIGVLLIQCLLFADGGLLALGCNVWNMAFYGCFVGYYLIWRPMTRRRLSGGRILAGSLIASMLTLQLGAFSVAVETLLSGVTKLPFSAFVAVMQPIHLAIGFVEGAITAAVLLFVYQARPELLDDKGKSGRQNRFSYKRTIAVLGVFAVITGAGLSLAASSYPDGLEWSIQQVAKAEEIEAEGGGVYAAAEGIQSATSLLPDYAFPESENRMGTSCSGIVGAVFVLALCVGVCYAIRFWGKKRIK